MRPAARRSAVSAASASAGSAHCARRVAKALGITTDELKTDLGKGQSIADIAKSKNLDVNTVIDTLVGDASAKIDQAVTDGHLTQAQADKLKAGAQDR